jgi:nucleotide-binding universal stress UspA family protein
MSLRQSFQSLLITHGTIVAQANYRASDFPHALNAMINIQRILCPTDLSTNSDQAVRYALTLARSYSSKLTLLYGAAAAELDSGVPIQQSEVGYAFTRGNSRQLFEGSLLHFLEPLKMMKLDWDGLIVKTEDVGETIVTTAAELRADLIVMRSRRRPHRAALLGSTAESVCRTAPCPVLVTHADEREWVDESAQRINIKRVLVAYDFSDYSELALKYALSVAQEYQADLHLQHVLPKNSSTEPEIAWSLTGQAAYYKAAQRLQKVVPPEAHLWCRIKNIVSEGQPYREVLSYAEKNEIDLISIGAHGAGFGMRALFGSNVDRVLRQAPCPVLVARPLKPTQ